MYVIVEKQIGYEVEWFQDIFDAIIALKSLGTRKFKIVTHDNLPVDWKAYEQAIDKCFDRCNLIGEDVDIWGEMWKYKALREATEDMKEQAYDAIASRMGFYR